MGRDDHEVTRWKPRTSVDRVAVAVADGVRGRWRALAVALARCWCSGSTC